jgi:type II secretory pathway predicted ATPase ExeA
LPIVKDNRGLAAVRVHCVLVHAQRPTAMDKAKLMLRENPFPAAPSPENYLAIGSIESARLRLMETIERREGIGLIVGPAGTGKSLLCSLLAEHYRDEFDVVLLSEARLCTRKALLQHILHHLGLPFSDRSEGELRLAVIDRASLGGPQTKAGLLLIVDEAQIMPGRLLEELRLMAGIVRSGAPRVQLILAGGTLLDERLSHPRMESLSQRIGARCYLHPLGQNETGQYIREALQRVGTSPALSIDPSAIQSTFFASGGIPRLINQTVSRALARMEREGGSRLTGEVVELAWADLQQLPSPISDNDIPRFDSSPIDSQASRSPSERRTDSVVEFGTLEEDYSLAPDAIPLTTSKSIEPAKPKRPFYEQAAKYDPMAETVDYEPETETPLQEGSITTFELDEVFEHQIDGDLSEDIDEVVDENPQTATVGLPEELGLAPDDELFTPDLTGLFGDEFDDEEFLPSSFSKPLVVGRIPPIEANLLQDSIVQQELDEAFWLHNEILSINNDAIGGTIQFDDSEESDVEIADSDIGGRLTDLAGDIVIRDDSDMLVIEEDLEGVDPNGLFTNSPPRQLNDSASDVDFQAIFSKLREG